MGVDTGCIHKFTNNWPDEVQGISCCLFSPILANSPG